MKSLPLLFFLGLSWLTQAQFYIGPTLGTKFSTVSFFDDISKKNFKSLPAFGFDGGVMVSRRIKDRFVLNAEIIYSQKGKIVKGRSEPYIYNHNGKTEVGNPDKLYRNNQKNHFIEIPIYYSLEFKNRVGKDLGMAGTQKSYKWFIGGGPTISFWLGGKGNLQTSNLKEIFIDDLKYKIVYGLNNDNLNATDNAHIMNVNGANRVQLGLNFTGGIALEPVGFQKIVIAMHAELGQSFMAKSDPGFFPGANVDLDPLRTKCYSLRLSVGYLFDTKIELSKRGKSTNKQSNKNKKKRR